MHTATADHTLPLMGHLVIGYPTLEQSLKKLQEQQLIDKKRALEILSEEL